MSMLYNKGNGCCLLQVIGIPRDCIKYKTKMSSRNALNPIWEETFELDLHLPDLAFLRFTVIDVTSNLTTAQRVVPVYRLRSGYRHLRLHNELDQPLPLSQLFLCSQFNEETALAFPDNAEGIDDFQVHIGHINRNHETSSKRGRLERFTASSKVCIHSCLSQT